VSALALLRRGPTLWLDSPEIDSREVIIGVGNPVRGHRLTLGDSSHMFGTNSRTKIIATPARIVVAMLDK
jgi:hypothetical protein